MVVVLPTDSLFSAEAQKRFGRPCEFGFEIYGFSAYGAEFQGVIFEPFGVAEYGGLTAGNYLNCSGIFQRRHMLAGRGTVLEKYMVPRDPRAPAVLANRAKFAAAIAAWQGLTEPERAAYNRRVVGRDLSGYNLFIREYMHG